MIRNIITLTFLMFVLSSTILAQGQSESIVKYSNGRITTHHLKPNNSGFVLGVTENAGGIINEITIPGKGDVTDRLTDQYGRAGQSSLRDGAHRGKYNPTQAGFNERLGTFVKIRDKNGKVLPKNTTVGDKLVVGPFQLALWKADGDYDFTEYEGPKLPGRGTVHPRQFDDWYSDEDETKGGVLIKGDNGDSDSDGLVEGPEITHGDEVGSNFTYYGEYENIMNTGTGDSRIKTPVIRHYYEYRFDLGYNHAMSQFELGKIRPDARTSAGLPILNTASFTKASLENNTSLLKNNNYKTTKKDMTDVLTSWSIRMDTDKWEPKYRHVQRNNGKWEVQNRVGKVFRGNENYKELIILSENNNPNSTSGNSIGLYRPVNDINEYSVIGRDKRGNDIDGYKYNRQRSGTNFVNDNIERANGMSWTGFKNGLTYLLGKEALENGTYEVFRQDFYIFYGTTAEIKEAIKALEKQLEEEIITTVESEFSEDQLSVFPNPSNSGLFTINTNQNWEVYNYQGQLIKVGNGEGIDLNTHPKGIYLLKVNDQIIKLVH